MSAGAMTFNYFICRPSTRIPLLYVKVPVHLSENTPRKMQGAIICIKLMEGDQDTSLFSQCSLLNLEREMFTREMSLNQWNYCLGFIDKDGHGCTQPLSCLAKKRRVGLKWGTQVRAGWRSPTSNVYGWKPDQLVVNPQCFQSFYSFSDQGSFIS